MLASWAVPRGIPPGPERNHLAVRTEDHPLEYLEFHGEIPAGQYGAGTMKIWDRGTYEEHKFRDDEVMVTFHGERVRGRYVLFRTRGDDWMIHRMDPPDDPEREPMPERLEPMLARTGDAAARRRRLGVRDQVGRRAGDRVRPGRPAQAAGAQRPRRHARATRSCARSPQALAGHEVILDGEVVAFDGARPSFQKLQGRMHLASEHAIRRLAREDPVHYIAFDLLYLDGRSLMELRYDERRAALAELELQGPTWQAPAHHVGDGAALLEADARAAARGRDRQAAGLPLHARPPHVGLGEGQEHRHDRRRHRRLARRRGRPLRAARRARDRDPRRGGRAALRRAASGPASPRPS